MNCKIPIILGMIILVIIYKKTSNIETFKEMPIKPIKLDEIDDINKYIKLDKKKYITKKIMIENDSQKKKDQKNFKVLSNYEYYKQGDEHIRFTPNWSNIINLIHCREDLTMDKGKCPVKGL